MEWGEFLALKHVNMSFVIKADDCLDFLCIVQNISKLKHIKLIPDRKGAWS